MKIPLFTELEGAQNILIVGAGGGFDVFCGLPLYFWLRNAGKTVHLANLSFSELGFCEGERLPKSMPEGTTGGIGLVSERLPMKSQYTPQLRLG